MLNYLQFLLNYLQLSINITKSYNYPMKKKDRQLKIQAQKRCTVTVIKRLHSAGKYNWHHSHLFVQSSSKVLDLCSELCHCKTKIMHQIFLSKMTRHAENIVWKNILCTATSIHFKQYCDLSFPLKLFLANNIEKSERTINSRQRL